MVVKTVALVTFGVGFWWCLLRFSCVVMCFWGAIRFTSILPSCVIEVYMSDSEQYRSEAFPGFLCMIHFSRSAPALYVGSFPLTVSLRCLNALPSFRTKCKSYLLIVLLLVFLGTLEDEGAVFGVTGLGNNNRLALGGSPYP